MSPMGSLPCTVLREERFPPQLTGRKRVHSVHLPPSVDSRYWAPGLVQVGVKRHLRGPRGQKGEAPSTGRTPKGSQVRSRTSNVQQPHRGGEAQEPKGHVQVRVTQGKTLDRRYKGEPQRRPHPMRPSRLTPFTGPNSGPSGHIPPRRGPRSSRGQRPQGTSQDLPRGFHLAGEGVRWLGSSGRRINTKRNGLRGDSRGVSRTVKVFGDKHCGDEKDHYRFALPETQC